MRIGKNPAAGENNLKIDSYHRVIIPVYIPNLNDTYFKYSFQIFQMCIRSLIYTVHIGTRISLYSNGSCKEVLDYLHEIKSKEAVIDQLFISDKNVGKINAVNTCIRGNIEQLITITDADVLFKAGWQQAVENIFVTFPKAGMVSPVPVSNLYKQQEASNTIGYGFFKRQLKFMSIKDLEGLKRFEQSVGSKLFNGERSSKFLCLSNTLGDAVVGCGHFVATLRREVFEKSPRYPSYDLISSASDRDYIDIPNNKSGFLRLACIENKAFHMGNTPEEWMQRELNQSKVKGKDYKDILTEIPKAKTIGGFKRWIYTMIYKCTMQINVVRKMYFRMLGMTDTTY